MSITPCPEVFRVGDDDARTLRRVAQDLTAGARDAEDVVRDLPAAVGELPGGLVEVLDVFRTAGNRLGRIVLAGLPLPDALPPTPCVPESVAGPDSPSFGVVALVMGVLGRPLSFAEEKGGALLHDICPTPGEEDRQENTGSVYFELHTENVFHPDAPDFLGLFCLRPDPREEGVSLTSSILDVLPTLSDEDRELLQRPRFRHRVAPSFCRGLDERPLTGPTPVLRRAGAAWTVAVDFDDTAPCDDEAAAALDRLDRAFRYRAQPAELDAGDMLVVDNFRAVHGRTAFRPRYDGDDRWLQRMHCLRHDRVMRSPSESGYRCRPLELIT